MYNNSNQRFAANNNNVIQRLPLSMHVALALQTVRCPATIGYTCRIGSLPLFPVPRCAVGRLSSPGGRRHVLVLPRVHFRLSRCRWPFSICRGSAWLTMMVSPPSTISAASPTSSRFHRHPLDRHRVQLPPRAAFQPVQILPPRSRLLVSRHRRRCFADSRSHEPNPPMLSDTSAPITGSHHT